MLQVACVEACLIQEADCAAARWRMGDGRVVSAQTGEVDEERARTAFVAVATAHSTRGPGWIAHPLPSSDPWQEAALVVFVGTDLSEDEELVLGSLASLIPVAFERALGTEAAVRHEARWRAVIEASPVALIGVSRDGTVTLANRAALDRLDWVPDPAQWVLREPMRAEILQLAEAVRAAGTVVNRTASGEGFDLALSGARLPSTSPGDEGTVLIAGVDLTGVRRAEQALVQAQRLEAMGVVAGRVAHDFNNLLTLIIGYTELLARGLDDPHLGAFVDEIEGAARRAATLTEQMLGMTRGGHRRGGRPRCRGRQPRRGADPAGRAPGVVDDPRLGSGGEGPHVPDRDRADRHQPGGQRLRRHGRRGPGGGGRRSPGRRFDRRHPDRGRAHRDRQRPRHAGQRCSTAASSPSSPPKVGARAADWDCPRSSGWSTNAAATSTSTRRRG